MSCRECPYGMHYYSQLVDDVAEFEQVLRCDKTGGELYCTDMCEDVYSRSITKTEVSSRRKRSNKRERDKKYKEHIKSLAKNSEGSYLAPAYYKCRTYVGGIGYVKLPKPYYKRIYRRKASRYIKRASNKNVRRYQGELSKGGMYRKVYDYWWELY